MKVPTPAEQVIPNSRNLIKISVLFSLILSAFIAGHYGAVAIEHYIETSDHLMFLVKWSWLLLCGMLASFAIQGLGIIGHDTVHKALLKNKWANKIVGTFISTFA